MNGRTVDICWHDFKRMTNLRRAACLAFFITGGISSSQTSQKAKTRINLSWMLAHNQLPKQ